ncbi:MAG: redoxin domain-containing protein, partial [Pseudomonadota bacterium]
MNPIGLLAAAGFFAAGTAFATEDHSGDGRPHDHQRHIVIGEAGELKEGAAQIIGARFLDVDGAIRRLGDENGPGPAALVFVDSECPVSSRYLGEMNTFAAEAAKQGVDFYAIMSSAHRTWDDAKALRDQYGLEFPVLFDPSGDLAARLDPVTLAEAFVIDEKDRMIYRGRIDDRFAGIGQLRRVIRNHDLLDALAVAGTTEAIPRATAPIGCFFEGWKKPVTERAVTYNRDIAPILAANCAECHQEGGIAPFSLQSYGTAIERSGMLEYVTAEGLMPPWRPKPEYGRFRDERYLSQTQIDLFSAWTANDDAKGDAVDRAPAVKLPDPGWRLGPPDLLLRLVEPYHVPASGEDVYRYFVIPSSLADDRVVKAIDFRPGAVEVVHHANFFADYDGRARKEDAKDSEPGFSVFGTGEF